MVNNNNKMAMNVSRKQVELFVCLFVVCFYSGILFLVCRYF